MPGVLDLVRNRVTMQTRGTSAGLRDRRSRGLRTISVTWWTCKLAFHWWYAPPSPNKIPTPLPMWLVRRWLQLLMTEENIVMHSLYTMPPETVTGNLLEMSEWHMIMNIKQTRKVRDYLTERRDVTEQSPRNLFVETNGCKTTSPVRRLSTF